MIGVSIPSRTLDTGTVSLEPVPNTEDADHVAGLLRLGLDLLAEVADVGVDDALRNVGLRLDLLVEAEITHSPELIKVSALTVDDAFPIGVDVNRNRACIGRLIDQLCGDGI